MYPVSDEFLQSIPRPPEILSRVEVWRGGVRVDPYGDDGLPFEGGKVDVDLTKSTRRILNGLSTEASEETWRLLSPPGTQLRCWRGFRYRNQQTELAPLGRFTIDDLSESYGGNWDGQVGAAPDGMGLVQRARFLTPRSFPAGLPIRDVIATLVGEVLGTVAVQATSTDPLTSDLVAERDRLGTVQKLAESIGADVFVTPDGIPTVRDLPQLGNPVWTVSGGDLSVLYGGTRSQSLSKTYSAVVASAAGVSGEQPFPPQVVYDDDPTSPTYYLGPFGLVPYFMSSELFGSADQADRAARARLPFVTSLPADVTMSVECNPALADGDTLAVELPRSGRSSSPLRLIGMVEAMSVPLSFADEQSITLRSGAPRVEDSE